MHLNELARSMKTAGDERRLRIICHLLKRKQLCVSEIAHDLKMSVATTSHHLQVMAEDDIVIAVRDGKRICYKLSDSDLLKSMKKFICSQVKL